MNRAERRAAERQARRAEKRLRLPTPAVPAEADPDASGEFVDAPAAGVQADPGAIRATAAWDRFEPLRRALLVDSGLVVPWGDPSGCGVVPTSSPVFEVRGRLADRLAGDPDFGGYADAYRETIEQAVGRLVRGWAVPGIDGRGPGADAAQAVALHRAVDEAFGLHAWEPPARMPLRAAAEELSRRDGPALRGFVRAVYVETQDWLAQLGVERVQLWRGVAVAAPDGFARVGLRLRAISSFTPSCAFACTFATGAARKQRRSARVLLAEVPRARILSTPLTGLGLLSLGETLVLGGGERDAAWAMTWADRPSPFGAPAFLEETYLAAAEHRHAGRRDGPLANPVWRPAWDSHVLYGLLPDDALRGVDERGLTSWLPGRPVAAESRAVGA